MSVLKTLRQGNRYMEQWPMAPQLAPLFPEYRVIKATQLATRLMPPAALLVMWVNWQWFGQVGLPQSLAYALFMLSLPIQGLFWLGWRSQQPLPKPLVAWCDELRQKMLEAGEQISPLGAKAQYWNMAILLRRVFSSMDKTQWRQFD